MGSSTLSLLIPSTYSTAESLGGGQGRRCFLLYSWRSGRSDVLHPSPKVADCSQDFWNAPRARHYSIVRVSMWTAVLCDGSSLCCDGGAATLIWSTAAKSQCHRPRPGRHSSAWVSSGALATWLSCLWRFHVFKNPKDGSACFSARPVEEVGWSQLGNAQAVRKASPVSSDPEEDESFVEKEKAALEKASFCLRFGISEKHWALNT